MNVTSGADANQAAPFKLEVIDADGHVVEPPDLWGGPYMPAAYRELGPTISLDDGRLRFANGNEFPEAPNGRSWVDVGTLGFERTPGAVPHYGDGRKGATDPKGRIDDLDLDGIDGVALYPTVGLSLCYIDDVGLASAMARAYNSWIADWSSECPERLIGVAMLPVQSVEAAVTELRFARTKLGLKAAFLRPHVYRGRTIHSRDWDPLWAEAQDLDCAIALHGGGSWPTPQAGADRFTDSSCPAWTFHVVTHPFEQQLALVGLIMSGAFERFPKLRVAFLESGGGWVVPLLERLERHFDQSQTWDTLKLGHYGMNQDTGTPNQMRPRECFEQNCWISFEPVEDSLGLLADWIGPTNILWATDYPHRDGFFPHAPKMIKERLEGRSAETRSAVLGGGARAFYNL